MSVTSCGKKQFLCLLALARGALERLPEGRNTHTLWPGCEVCVMNSGHSLMEFFLPDIGVCCLLDSVDLTVTLYFWDKCYNFTINGF